MKTINKSSLFALVWMAAVVVVKAQIVTVCTPEHLAQVRNEQLAASIKVVSVATQQQQTYYQQLATYWQQIDKDNQQKAKDAQQLAKDQQQAAKDAQQIAYDKVLAERTAALNTCGTRYDELLTFIEAIYPYVPDTSPIKVELYKIHTNRSGQADGTNPGGQTHNINGFDNPAWTILTNK
jgi:hypothetical protein